MIIPLYYTIILLILAHSYETFYIFVFLFYKRLDKYWIYPILYFTKEYYNH